MNATTHTITLISLLLASGCASLDQASARNDKAKGNPANGGIDLSSLAAPAAGLPLNHDKDRIRIQAVTAPTDFWQLLREDFSLPYKQHTAVKQEINTYRRHAYLVQQTLKRAEPYLAYINREVEKRGFPGEITLLPFVESGYDPFAYSHGRAAGLWQFIPGTAKQYGLKQDWWYDGRRDVIASTKAALDYLDKLQHDFNGDWLLALAAYNAGSGTVRKAIKRNRKAGKPVDFWHLRLPSETSDYVPRLLAISQIIEQSSDYGIELPSLAAEPYFTVMDIHDQLDLGIAAKLAEIEPDLLTRLNPGFNHWATHPEGPHHLAIPTGNATVFRKNLAELPATERVKWTRHKISPGETLSHIAGRYHTTVAVLRDTNDLNGSTIRSGRHLLVPVASQDSARHVALVKSRQTPRGSGNKLTHRVRDGETLWQIARNHQVSVRQLIRWNKLDEGSLIKPGQTLVIWQQGKHPRTTRTLRSVHYTVRSGDSLFHISRKFNVTVNDLRQWNTLPKGSHIRPGQRLKLYIDVTQQTANRS